MEGIIYIINEADIHRLAEKLIKGYDVYGPVNTHDEAVFSKFQFKKIETGDKLELHYGVTTIPPTKYLFPPREDILCFQGGKDTAKNKKPQKKIIFGVNLADLTGINYLDKEFLEPIIDEVYEKNRAETFVFSIDHFDPDPGLVYDLHLKKIGGNNYEVTSGSDFGKKILEENKTLLSKLQAKSDKQFRPRRPSIHHKEISAIIARSKSDPIWDELAEICFGCGICTYVCPVCYCFDVEDKGKIEGLAKCAGCRQRRWDSCMTSDFAAISSHDFRPELRDRIYNWYHHKFVRTPKEHGFIGCADCERCIVYCPAKINFHETLQHLIKKHT